MSPIKRYASSMRDSGRFRLFDSIVIAGYNSNSF